MDHVFGSKWLVNKLSRLGFSITYDEVNRYKQSVIQSESFNGLLSEYLPGTFTQWVADNVDHNIGTLGGKGNLHGMGIIAVLTPHSAIPLSTKSWVITSQRKRNTNFVLCSPTEKGLASVFIKPVVELQVSHTLPPELYSNLLWHSGWMFIKAAVPSSNWSGFMESCVYSTLIYIQRRQAEELNTPSPCITFDQPLWLKAIEIIRAKSMHVVCKFGGFHTMMSFIGSIGSMKTIYFS